MVNAENENLLERKLHLCVDVGTRCDWTTYVLLERKADGTSVIVESGTFPTDDAAAKIKAEETMRKAVSKYVRSRSIKPLPPPRFRRT